MTLDNLAQLALYKGLGRVGLLNQVYMSDLTFKPMPS
jgi:hypothetical protein